MRLDERSISYILSCASSRPVGDAPLTGYVSRSQLIDASSQLIYACHQLLTGPAPQLIGDALQLSGSVLPPPANRYCSYLP